MGLAVAIVIGFLGVVGFSHKAAVAQKHFMQAQKQQVQIKKKTELRQMTKPQNTIALLDGVEIRNLKG